MLNFVLSKVKLFLQIHTSTRERAMNIQYKIHNTITIDFILSPMRLQLTSVQYTSPPFSSFKPCTLFFNFIQAKIKILIILLKNFLS